jgi:hypothetical protein
VWIVLVLLLLLLPLQVVEEVQVLTDFLCNHCLLS